MHPAHSALLTTTCLLAACGDPATEIVTPDGRIRVVAECQPEQLAATLGENDTARMVVAFADQIESVTSEVESVDGSAAPLLLAAGAIAQDATRMPDVVVTPASGAEMAVAIALLVQQGVDVPDNRIELGVRVRTPTNRAAGGIPHAGPGDAYLAWMRTQHARALTPNAQTDVVFAIGLVCTSEQAWQARIAAEVRAEILRFPQLELVTPAAQETPPAFAARIAPRCRVTIVVGNQPRASRAIAAAATRANDDARILVLDPWLSDGHGTCCVGCPADAVGRALAGEIAIRLPDGGDLVLCTDASPYRRSLRNGFVAAMQLRRR